MKIKQKAAITQSAPSAFSSSLSSLPRGVVRWRSTPRSQVSLHCTRDLAHGAVAIVVLFAALAGAMTCGTWTNTCQPYSNGQLITSSLVFEGPKAGKYEWRRAIYSSTSECLDDPIIEQPNNLLLLLHPLECNTQPYLLIVMNGSWIDFNFTDESNV